MKKLALLSLMVGLAGVPAFADHSTGATGADIRRLQTDIERLDDSLTQLSDSNPRAGEFRRREGELRDRLTTLQTQVRRHRQNNREGLGASQAEVEDVRQEVIALRGEVDRTLDRDGSATTGSVTVPDGTEFAVRLEQPVSSATARREDRVEATVAESVRVDGRIVIPAGATVRGIVTNAEPARRPSNGGRLELSFDQVEMANGRRADIRSRVVSIEEEGVSKKRAGIGAGLGGILGGILGGKQGALIGVLVGGGGAVVGSKGGDVELPAGTILNVRLDQFIAAR
ncbi:MAG: hypothetical protein ABW221_11560 [Vicinamibacteria bacterium]